VYGYVMPEQVHLRLGEPQHEILADAVKSLYGRREGENGRWEDSARHLNCPTQAKRRLEWATSLNRSSEPLRDSCELKRDTFRCLFG
jgi:hypothetical protein